VVDLSAHQGTLDRALDTLLEQPAS
jgi:hypothetical protein